jgi:chemotaxis protein methyltransferase CheR
MRVDGAGEMMQGLGVEAEISDPEFHLIQTLVHRHTGISLSEHKRSLVISRLGRRLRALELPSFRSYCDYLEGAEGAGELENFVNAITTNKTDFYRERVHFDFLAQEVIPALKTRAARTGERRIRIWSAGCSTGEEPYTIAVTLREGLGSLLGWDVRILASDIDTNVLAHATAGIYAADRVADIPEAILRAQFLRGTGGNAGSVRVRPEIQSLVTFRQINLLGEPWPIRATFDCIFCRNVIIYFDKPTQARLMQRFAQFLKDDGYLFLGHSESLHGICEQFAFLRNTIYRKAVLAKGAAA